ncbi:tetratricopeptide repeat protein [Marivirga harenae]|uniref:tetratricopeptide repeat protein n=1 Tax=Marivirga harenae TaxID=2010992 RepID=UPI0026E0A074|nr:tetratricopeptide repeat protein [Marivirga harenae]WKV10555.1 tetratricopeptide repeat protein [Marivirga harenae]|tara:strand:- start:515226 stop:515546 length:321 start_codon:yes stop_codon:yes gene_type:complete
MNEDRIAQLQKFKEESPNDPFIIYALATEYKEEAPEEAKKLFDELLLKHENYIGTYYHAAALYSEFFDRDRADEIYQKGISVAHKNGEHHALRELQNAYTNFQFEE